MYEIIDTLNEKYVTEKMAEEGMYFCYIYSTVEYIYFGREVCLYASDCDCEVENILEHCCLEYERYVNLLNINWIR